LVLSNRAMAQGFTMGRLINAITGTKNVLVLGHRQERKVVVTGRPTLTLRTLLAARSNLARWALRVGAEWMATCRRRAMPAPVGASCGTKPTRLSAWRFGQGRSRPGYPLDDRS